MNPPLYTHVLTYLLCTQIEALQKEYVSALRALYDRHKVQYGGRAPDAVLDVR